MRIRRSSHGTLTRFAPRGREIIYEKATRCGRARWFGWSRGRGSMWAPPSRKVEWNGTRPRVSGGAVGDVDRKGGERANRPRGARGCGCGHASPLRLRAAFSASEPMRSGLPLVCPARTAGVGSSLPETRAKENHGSRTCAGGSGTYLSAAPALVLVVAGLFTTGSTRRLPCIMHTTLTLRACRSCS